MSTNTTTAYKMIQALNVRLEELELKTLPPQYGYNEVRKGRVTGVEGSGQTITVEQAREWIANQLEARKNRQNVSGASVEELLEGIN